MKEIDFKKLFKRSIREYGGYSLSLSSLAQSGIPDLYIVTGKTRGLLLEAKWLGVVPDKFSRKIKYSAIQRSILSAVDNVCAKTAFGLIGLVHKREIFAVIVPPSIDTITSDFYTQYKHCKKIPGKDIFDIQSMLNDFIIGE